MDESKHTPPELLDALRELLALVESIDGGEHDDAPELVAARAAIAKAEGARPWIVSWTRLHPRADLGYLDTMLWDTDPRPAAEQFNERYAHNGGWKPMKGWTLFETTGGAPIIQYPSDPVLAPIAMCELRDERIYLYPEAWVAIVAADGTYQIARMD